MKSVLLILLLCCKFLYASPDSLFVIGKDTFATVPIQSINAANAVKVMNDEEKKLSELLKFQVNDLKLQRDVMRTQSRTYKEALDTCKHKNNDLIHKNNQLVAKNTILSDKNKKLIKVIVLCSVAILAETLYILSK